MEENKDLAASLGYKLVDDAQETPKKEDATTTEPTVEVGNTEGAEVKAETNSSLENEKSDTTTDSSTETQEVKTETPSLDDLLREKSGGKFESYDDLEKVLSEKPTETNTVEFANEQLAVLNQYVKDGGKIEDFVKTQIDYSSMTDLDVIKSEMRLNDPDITDADIEFLLNRKYKTNEEEYDEDEVRLSKINLRKDANKARKNLSEWQSKYSIPEGKEETTSVKEAEEIQAEQNRKLQQEKERWQGKVKDTVSKLEKFEFDINENGDKFTFNLSDNDRESIIETSSDLSKFWSRFMNEDGTENMEKLNKAMFIVDNFDKIVRAAASQYKSSGKDDVLKDIKNPDYNSESGTQESGNKSLYQQIYEGWKKGN